MNEIPDLLVLYLAAMNLLAFAAFGSDKSAARRGQRRIPEKTLFQLALLGGSLGALIRWPLFRHHPRQPSFTRRVPLFLIAHIAILWFLTH